MTDQTEQNEKPRPPIWATCPKCDQYELVFGVCNEEAIRFYIAANSAGERDPNGEPTLEYEPHDWRSPLYIRCANCEWRHDFEYEHPSDSWSDTMGTTGGDAPMTKLITDLHFQEVLNG